MWKERERGRVKKEVWAETEREREREASRDERLILSLLRSECVFGPLFVRSFPSCFIALLFGLGRRRSSLIIIFVALDSYMDGWI